MYLHEVHVDYNTWLQVKLAHGKEQLPVEFPTSYHTCELLGIDRPWWIILFFFYLLFYSFILESLTYYSFHSTYYSFIVPIILIKSEQKTGPEEAII